MQLTSDLCQPLISRQLCARVFCSLSGGFAAAAVTCVVVRAMKRLASMLFVLITPSAALVVSIWAGNVGVHVSLSAQNLATIYFCLLVQKARLRVAWCKNGLSKYQQTQFVWRSLDYKISITNF